MEITIVSESEHYALIKPPGGPVPALRDLLPALETLRSEHGLKLLTLIGPVTQDQLLLCEKLTPSKV